MVERGQMAIREQKFECGDYLEASIYPVFGYRCSQKGKRRRISRKPTREVQQALNRKNSARACNRLICANFTHDDWYLTLTFKGDIPTPEEAKKAIDSFLAKVKRRLAKLGKVMKWVKCEEVGTRNGRPHFHLVLTGGLTPQEMAALWGKGYIDCKPLMFSADGVMGLAKYFGKQKKNEAGDGKKGKSWTCSRSCTHPEPKTNDYRYTKRRAAELAKEKENARFFEKLYPGYICHECEPFYNDESGLYYIHMIFYRKGAKLDV